MRMAPTDKEEDVHVHRREQILDQARQGGGLQRLGGVEGFVKAHQQGGNKGLVQSPPEFNGYYVVI